MIQRSSEHNQRISEGMKKAWLEGRMKPQGLPHSPDHKLAISNGLRKAWREGRRTIRDQSFFNTKEYKDKMSRLKLGVTPYKMTDEIRKKISLGQKGKRVGPLNHMWISDRTKVKRYWTERDNPEYKRWRKAVLNRDKFTCKLKDEYCKGSVQVHHILPWREFPDLRYTTNNGITLCRVHHPRVRTEEKRLVPAFQELVSVL